MLIYNFRIALINVLYMLEIKCAKMAVRSVANYCDFVLNFSAYPADKSKITIVEESIINKYDVILVPLI